VSDDTYTPPRPRKPPAARPSWLLGAAVVLAGLGYGGYVLLNAHSEETDDAYVAGDIVQVTAREPGTVIAIHADNTQGVKAGQPLIDLDPRSPMRRSPRQARLASAVRQVRSGFSR
jgi:membrane fusion protein (multidrug efflux system)